MSEWINITGKTVNEALTEALIKLETTSDNVDFEVIEKESNGLLGLFSKPAKIRVKLKEMEKDPVEVFLLNVFKAMNIQVEITLDYSEEDNILNIDLSGPDMGILIGKRGQTLDSLQYLIGLVVNKDSSTYIKVKLDTENYRERRKETLENLARNIAHKVKKTRHAVTLESMNPYERRIIHSALQGDKYVETHSEGEEPYRKVVVTLKKGYHDSYRRSNNTRYSKGKQYTTYQKNKNRSEAGNE